MPQTLNACIGTYRRQLGIDNYLCLESSPVYSKLALRRFSNGRMRTTGKRVRIGGWGAKVRLKGNMSQIQGKSRIASGGC